MNMRNNIICVRILSIVTLYILSFCAFSQESSKSYQILPIDETQKDSSLARTVAEFRKAVLNKDTTALFSFFHPQIVSSFGDGLYGKNDFIESWGLNRADTMVWNELLRVIDLGGVFDTGGLFAGSDKDTIFHFPYANANRMYDQLISGNPEYWPFDPYTTLVSVRKDAPVYALPDFNSEIIARLFYEVVYIDYDETYAAMNPDKGHWEKLKIITNDQRMSGWVNCDDFYYEGDWSLVFERINGRWVITGFFPFD